LGADAPSKGLTKLLFVGGILALVLWTLSEKPRRNPKRSKGPKGWTVGGRRKKYFVWWSEGGRTRISDAFRSLEDARVLRRRLLRKTNVEHPQIVYNYSGRKTDTVMHI
jgi:hypothetical protein